jgi:hypothetical protein
VIELHFTERIAVPRQQMDGADRPKCHALCKEKSKGRATLAYSSSQALGAHPGPVSVAEGHTLDSISRNGGING